MDNNNNPLNHNENRSNEFEYKVGEQNANHNPTTQSNQAPNSYSNHTRPNTPQPPTAQQQTQWTFNDYGPLGSGGAKPPQPPKPPKKSGAGLKAFAIIISIMFVISTASFVGYAVYDSNLDNNVKKNGAPSSVQIDSSDKENTGTSDGVIDTTPPPSADGRLTTQEVFKRVNDSVVGIVVYVKGNGYQVYGQGSGVIMTEDGYIVTNAHVVTSTEYPIAKIDVVLSNGDYHEAKLIGADTKTDIAVLKVEVDGLSAAEFGDSAALEVGETVIVIGNPDGVKYANSLTQGVVSALNREVTTEFTEKPVKYIQTTAAINPGNSGGALINQHGQIVGIPVAKIIKTGYEGMCFAIPINDVKPVVESIVESGYVRGRVKIGITYQVVPESNSFLNAIPMGLRVVSVDENFDAAKAGVRAGDIITHMDGTEITGSADLDGVLNNKKPGETLALTIYRVSETGAAETLEISVTLGEMGPNE